MFSQYETKIIKEIAKILIPKEGNIPYSSEDVDIAKSVDEYLPDEGLIKNVFRLFLFLFEFLAIFSIKCRPFTKLDTISKHRYIESWINANSKYKKSIFSAMKKAILGAFYDDERIAHYIGYEEVCQ